MKTTSKGFAAAGALLLLGGCVSMPSGPSMMVLPGTGKSFDQFRADDADCRELRGQNYARGRTEKFRLAICKPADGKWRLAPFEAPGRASTISSKATRCSPA